MKKHLLIAAGLFTSAFSFSQFNQGNEPVVGDGTTLYVIDSMAPDYSGVTGTGVEWDYSTYGGYEGEPARNITILDPSSTAYGSEFAPPATATMDIQGFIKTYSSSTSTERTGHGFVYTDDMLGDIRVVFETDEAIQYNYPFELNDNLTDNYSGTTYVDLFGSTQTMATSGQNRAEVDGVGTLKLSNGNDFPNVTRYKLTDSTVLQNAPILNSDVLIKRVQYEYYDLAASPLPIFVHAYINIVELGTEFNLVMSSVEPTEYVGVEENVLSNAVVYPNPASDVINISMKNELTNAKVSIVDAMGRVVLNQSIDNDFVSLDVAGLEEGIYFVKIANGDAVETKTVVIK